MLRRLLVVVVLTPQVSGCGGDQVKIAPVSGQVTLNGEPLANAAVLFSPVTTGPSVETGPSSGGNTDAKGHYVLSLIVPDKKTKGAVIGQHKVRIYLIQKDDPANDKPKPFTQLPSRYNARDTELEFDVPAAGTESANFALTSP